MKNSSGAEKANIGRSAGQVFYDLGVAETGPKRADLLAISEKAYLESLSVAPDNNDALNNLAYLYVEYLNQPDKAFPYAQRAYILSPGVANVADTYGWVLAKLKRYDKAIDVLEQVIEVPEGNPAFRYHLGWVYEQTGQRDKARGQYESALTATTDDKAPLYDLLKKAIERVKK
jgi:Tfp pilus assembly protein PilF